MVALLALALFLLPAAARQSKPTASALAPIELLVEGLGNLGGIAVDGTGAAFVSDWEAGKIFKIVSGDSPEIVVERLQARTLFVNNTDPSCGGDSPCYTTIQAAVNAALGGDTIQIQAGTYREQVSISGKNNTAGATEASRILIEADPQAPLGSVVLQGTVARCTHGHAVRFQQSKFITLRGLTITGAGGPAIWLRGGHHQNQAIHLERLRIFGNGSSECSGGITIAHGNPGTLIVNSLIYANGRNGIRFTDEHGGPHYLVNNTIHANERNGVKVAHGHEVFLVNNLITQNGTRPGPHGGGFGVEVERHSGPRRQRIHLVNDLICGNRFGEINGPALDATDADNLTPTGTEGPGVSASPGCDLPGAVYATVNGPDGLPNTADDDFALAVGSPAIDRGMDPRTLGLHPLAFNPLFEADFTGDGARPEDGTRTGTAKFDIGAVEFTPPNRPPVANAGADRTVAAGTVLNLDGGASSDPDSDPLTFKWGQTVGPPVTLSNPTIATPLFTAPPVTAQTVLTFALRVSDGRLSSTASVNITVVPPPNRSPILDPIGDKPIAVGSTLTFTVTGSDPDGDPLTFSVAPQPLPANASFDPATHVFTFTPAGNRVGSFSLTFSVADGRGGTASETITIAVTAALQIAITSPTAGATVPTGSLPVRGTADAGGAEVGVVVNGIPAAIQGTTFAALVPVAPDTTTVTAVATTAGGVTATHSVAITVSGTPPGTLLATPQTGVAPMTVAFSLAGGASPATISLDFDGNGTTDFTGPKLDGQTFTYTQPGLYFPTATVPDVQGNQFIARAFVQVYDTAALDALLQRKWRAMRDALRVGDIASAMTHIVGDMRADYEAAFRIIAARLPNIDAILTDLVLLEVRDGAAIYEGTRTDAGLVKSFEVRFAIDDDGVWRIEAF